MPTDQDDALKQQLLNALRALERRHEANLSGAASKLLQALIAPGNLAHCQAGEGRFDKAGIQAQQATSPNNLRQRVQLLNRFFEAQGIDATLSSRKDGYWLTFDERLLAVYADAAQEAFLRRSKDFDDHGYSPPQAYPEPRVFVSHKWYGNKRMNKVVDAFIAELRRQLSHPPEDRPSIRLFFDRGGFNKSEPYLPQQDQACAAAQIGLILWHLDYQDSKDCLRECEFFITTAGDNQPGKRAIVVLAHDRLADCPRRFTQRIVHCDPKHGALQQVWETASETQKADYVRALRDEIYQAWDLLTAPDPSAHQDDQALLRAARPGDRPPTGFAGCPARGD